MKKAFTLVEMLVAVVLITLLIGVALFAFRLQIITIAKTKKSAIDTVITYEQIRSSLESVKYYVVDKYDIIGRPMRQLHYYFHADPTTINYITTNPIMQNTVSVARLTCQNRALLYYEEPLYHNIDYLRPSIPENNQPVKLYDMLDICRFSYRLLTGEEVTSLQDSIPATIYLHLKRVKKDISITVNVKSDYNTSKSEIESMLYDD